jgi:hypothetical protein
VWTPFEAAQYASDHQKLMRKFHTQKALIIGGTAMLLAAAFVPGQTVVEQWTFDTEATANVGINGSTVDVWDPLAAGNSWSGGVLTWSERGGAAAVNLPGGGIDTSTISSLTLTVEFADMSLPIGPSNEKDQIRMFFNATGGNPELEINAFNNTQISPDIEYNGSTGDLDVNMFRQDQETPPYAVTMVATWDFANNQMLFSATGPGGPYSGSVAVADLASEVGTINQFDLNFSNSMAGSFLALDQVTIETTPIPEAPSVLLEEWTFDGTNPETGTNGLTIDTWTTTSPNSVPSAGILRFATSGNATFASLGGIDPSTIAKLTMTINVSDFLIGVGTDGSGVPNSTGSDTVAFQIGTDAGSLELEWNAFQTSGQFAPDLEQGTGNTDDLDVTIMEWTEQSAVSPLELVATWDFVNNEMSLAWSGTKTGSQTVAAANLANITSIDSFRVRGGNMTFGTFLDLDSVTIETTPISEPSPLLLVVGLNGGNLDFSWSSQSGLVYDLVASNGLAGDPLSWTPVPGQTGIPADASGTTTTSIPLPPEPRTFYAVIEKNP